MGNTEKTNSQLLNEITELRKRIKDLEETQTESKKVEQFLRETLEKLSSIINTIPDIIYKLDTDGKIVFTNDSVKQYGYTPEELYGKYIFDLVHPDDYEKAKYHINERRTGDRRSISFELRLLTKKHDSDNSGNRTGSDDSVPFLIIEAEGVYDGAPGKSEFLGTIGIARNISDFKRAQQELRKAQDYAQNIVDCSLDMIVAVDNDRHIIEFNRAACIAFGYTREEVIGKHVNILYADEKRSDEIAAEVLKSGKFVEEILNIRKNRETFTSLLSVSVMRDKDGEIIGAVGNSCDIDFIRR